jgi:hypothetical protein
MRGDMTFSTFQDLIMIHDLATTTTTMVITLVIFGFSLRPSADTDTSVRV